MYSPQVVELLARERQREILEAAQAHWRWQAYQAPANDGAASPKRTWRGLFAWLRREKPAPKPAAAPRQPARALPNFPYPEWR